VGQSDADILRRRRRFFVLNVLLSGSFAVAGMQIGVLDGNRIGYYVAAVFGVFAVAWEIRLLIPPEILLALPDSHFHWIAPSEPGAQPCLSGMQPTRKASLLMPGPTPSMDGVCDRELDGTP
jgi:hypothetical protein